MCLDHPQRAFGGLYRCAKFGWNRCSSFDNKHVFLISRVWLENADSGPKNCGFGDSNETCAPTANLPNSAQLAGRPYHSPKLHPGPCRSVDVLSRTDTHIDRKTDTQTRVTSIHFTSSTTHMKCNEPCLSLLPPTKASMHPDRYSFSMLLRTGG